MQVKQQWLTGFIFSFFLLISTGCAQHHVVAPVDNDYPYSANYDESKYVAHLPRQMDTGNEKLVLVDPVIHAWGAYDANGQLVRGGIATAGADYCYDEKRPCRTDAGTFRIYYERGEDCVSKIYPIHKGGALMPYCMFFHEGQSLHGSPDNMLVETNISHGCVHIRIPDAEWLHDQFVKIGTKVIIMPY